MIIPKKYFFFPFVRHVSFICGIISGYKIFTFADTACNKAIKAETGEMFNAIKKLRGPRYFHTLRFEHLLLI